MRLADKFIMKISFNNILCWILMRSVEIYYGDSLKELRISD